MSIQSLINSAPFILSTSQCVTVNTKSFPRKYINELGQKKRISHFFNGSICTHNGKIWFAARGDCKPWFRNIRTVFCQLDANFVPIAGTARFLEVAGVTEKGENRVEDGRLFSCDDSLQMFYGDGYAQYHAFFNPDMTVSRWKPLPPMDVERPDSDGRIKNLTPFAYNKKPYTIFCDSPQRVIWSPFEKKIIISGQDIKWDYGIIRGGTPAIPYGDNEYITFFHSAVNVNKYNYMNGRVYFCGAYTFSNKPPFKVTRITKAPIIKGTDPQLNPIQTGKLAVIFPSGLIESRDSFFMSAGINDHHTGIFQISKSLIPLLLSPIKD